MEESDVEDLQAALQKPKASQAIVNGVHDSFHNEVVSTNGLLPNLSAWYIHSWSPRWAFVSRFDWLGADIDKYDGYIINASVRVNFAFAKHIAGSIRLPDRILVISS